MVLDTNILIYSTKPGGGHLRQWLDDPGAMVSIVSRIEALGFPGLSADDETSITSALVSLPEIGLTEAIAAQAIVLRQRRKMGLADAVIAATALFHNVPLVTRNFDDFKSIRELKLINPFSAHP